MADLLTHKTYKNDKFEILTDDGFKDFKGIIIGTNPHKLLLKFSNDKSLICTPKHKIYKTSNLYVFAEQLEIGDYIQNGTFLIEKKEIQNEDLVYEMLEVSDNHRYLVNGILSRQCLILDEIAFVEEHLLTPFWSSVFPIISSSKKSKVFMCSTPNGTGNLFHKIYTGSIDGTNGWENDLILWNEVPGRTDKWAKEIKAGLASEETFNQEFNCEFINTGTSSLNETLYAELKKQTRPPLEILMDGKYQIWDHPNPERLYVVGVDTSEGVGGDYSVVKVLDITDLQEILEVAEYHDNTISVADFSNKVYEILQHWGNPLVCIERNNQGGQVADRLGIDYGYHKMVNWGSKLAGRKNLELFGMVSQRNTKYHACSNARYYYSDRGAVILRNEQALDELFKDFVKLPNDTWGAISGKHDDRTMALIWALMILEKDLCERWFNIDEFDACGKPLRISPLDYGVQYFDNATSIYTNEMVAGIEQSRLSPIAFGGFSEQSDEITQLQNDGWELLGGGGMPYTDPSRTFNDSQWDSYGRIYGR